MKTSLMLVLMLNCGYVCLTEACVTTPSLHPEINKLMMPEHRRFVPGFAEVLRGEEVPPLLQERLVMRPMDPIWRAPYTDEEMHARAPHLVAGVEKVRGQPGYSAPLATDLPTLQPVISAMRSIAESAKAQLDTIENDAERVAKQSALRQTHKPEIEEQVAQLNKVIAEARKRELYGSEEIEDAYVALAVVSDVFGLHTSLMHDVESTVKRLQHDPELRLRTAVAELRFAYGTGDIPSANYKNEAEHEALQNHLNSMALLQEGLSELYKHCYTEYEQVRSEIYYLLKRIREQVGWTEEHLDQAILDAKALAGEWYNLDYVHDWRSLVPEIPSTALRRIVSFYYDDEAEGKVKMAKNVRCAKKTDYPYNAKPLILRRMNIELAREWARLSDILEYFHEKQPTKKTEALYSLLVGLADNDFFVFTSNRLFCPWFDPAKYTRGCRVLHAELHFMRLAIYGTTTLNFGYDMMRNLSRLMKDEYLENMSVLDEAAYALYNTVSMIMGEVHYFFRDSPGLQGTWSTASAGRCVGDLSWMSLGLRLIERQCFELLDAKCRNLEHETEVIRLIENSLILLVPGMLHRTAINTGYYARHPEACAEYLFPENRSA